MVKLKGPGMAQSASGSLADQLIYSSNKGRPYLKLHAKPAQPRTPPQVAMRGILQFLSEEWRNIAPADQALWEPLAAAKTISPFNAFQALNLERWRSGKAPTQVPTADDTGAFGTISAETVVGVERGILITFNVDAPFERWAALIYWTPGFGDPKAWNLFIHAIETRTAGPRSWTWRPLPSGLYNICISASRTHGFLWPSQRNYAAVVP